MIYRISVSYVLYICRVKVEKLCVQLILLDLHYCQENGMDRVMWKWCFHVLIEALRTQDTHHQKSLQQCKMENSKNVYSPAARVL